jgi:hypothetical protein
MKILLLFLEKNGLELDNRLVELNIKMEYINK